MPCDCSHLVPTAKEAELLRVNTLLLEIQTGRHLTRKEALTKFGCYGNGYLDELTRDLCKACKKLGSKIKKKSLELQIWWRDHQKIDAEKKANVKRGIREKTIRKKALAKLSRAERLALGL